MGGGHQAKEEGGVGGPPTVCPGRVCDGEGLGKGGTAEELN